ncbi:hypothetical protein SCP_0113730 [Sparassis crispa]|uniref:NADP-dependent oxidoreductase domain-containing protein n=1 Tax=Sparassis crispa TaxID=139825 RepID=A0A401G8J4_9APHY|nr:hypothetical protein SCP_0113730 [Sparassis crispa]GBE78484.1 hypothetical protein SCP_0113730 [Sparassis crispa]
MVRRLDAVYEGLKVGYRLFNYYGNEKGCSAGLKRDIDEGIVKREKFHPYNVQLRLVEYAHSLGIAVTVYSSFGPLGFHELNMKKALNMQPLFMHPPITTLVASHACMPSQIVLHWATQRSIAVIPKSDTVRMMRDNMCNVEVHLSEEEMQEIGEHDRGLRFNEPADQTWYKITHLVRSP